MMDNSDKIDLENFFKNIPVVEAENNCAEDFGKWNYRILREETDGYTQYKIIEVFYDTEENISGWADVSEHCLIWETYEDLKGTYDKIKHAFDKPVLKAVEGDKLVIVDEIPE